MSNSSALLNWDNIFIRCSFLGIAFCVHRKWISDLCLWNFIQQNNYYLRGYPLDVSYLTMMLPNGRYKATLRFYWENNTYFNMTLQANVNVNTMVKEWWFRSLNERCYVWVKIKLDLNWVEQLISLKPIPQCMKKIDH